MIVRSQRTVLEKIVRPSKTKQQSSHPEDGDEQHSKHSLKLCFLGCEDSPNYGPYEKTALLFLELIASAITRIIDDDNDNSKKPSTTTAAASASCWRITLTVYKAKEGDFPKTTDEWDSFDGFILPGSFSSAHDADTIEWIHNLSNIIQKELVGMSRPTLGTCFGHQLYAHSFRGNSLGLAGRCAKCPAGPQAGRKSFKTTSSGRRMLSLVKHNDNNDEGSCSTDQKAILSVIDLFYTHGDMVDQIPNDIALSLGGNDNVPIQSVAYFKTKEEAELFANDSYDRSSSSSEKDVLVPKPIAITFQAHPEYCCDSTTIMSSTKDNIGFDQTLIGIMNDMKKRSDISIDEHRESIQDAKENYNSVQEQSINLMVAVGKRLGWFPSS